MTVRSNLRGRIRAGKEFYQPWRIYRGEIRELCISAKCLFANKGMPHDVLEMELKEEGWLQENEKLFDILRVDENLRRPLIAKIADDCPDNYGLVPDDFTEEDYLANAL